MMKIRDRLNNIGSVVRSTMQPNHSFKTRRFSYLDKPFPVHGELHDGFMYNLRPTIHIWAEAKSDVNDEYSISLIKESRHGHICVDDNKRTTDSVIVHDGVIGLNKSGKAIFSKAEVQNILKALETEFQAKGYTLDKAQPFRAQHWSYIRETKQSQLHR